MTPSAPGQYCDIVMVALSNFIPGQLISGWVVSMIWCGRKFSAMKPMQRLVVMAMVWVLPPLTTLTVSRRLRLSQSTA